MSEKLWHYLHVNRGRYLCSEHGSFCDSSDGYAVSCPCCSCKNSCDQLEIAWTPNNIDRALQLINGLQNRSKRNLAALAGFLGAIGGLGALNAITGFINFESDFYYSPKFLIFLFLAITSLSTSLLLFSISLKQISVIYSCEFQEQNLSDWEAFFAKHLECLENLQKYAGYAFVFGIFCFLIILLFLICQQAFRLFQ
jgi:hypothetical protein